MTLTVAEQHADATGESIFLDFQAALDRWAGELIATGGALSPEKSFCYLIDFRWTGSKWEYRSLEDLPGEVTLLDVKGNRSPLKRYEPSVGTKTLCIFVAMDGTQDAQKK